MTEQKDASVEADVDSTEETLEGDIDELEARWFACEPDAEEARTDWLDDHDEAVFEFETTVVEGEPKKRRDSPGRQPADWEPYETAYRVEIPVSRDQDAITERKAQQSCFVVLTTITSDAGWPPAEVFEEYKAQQAVERRFPILKDPKRVGAVYLENPDRVEALGYLMILAVLVYSVIERRARRALADAEEPMWMVGGKTSFRPTGRRVLERFEDMTVMRVNDDTREIPSNFDVPERVLELLDLSVAVFGVNPSA